MSVSHCALQFRVLPLRQLLGKHSVAELAVVLGPDISTALVAALQKKLDDAVLEFLRDILTRNRMCKLMPEDVLFIQPPGSAPSDSVYFSVPPSGLRQQVALAYYVRQNLLEFVFKPNFSSSDDCIRDYTAVDLPPIPDTDVFLYNTAQQSRGKGQ